MKFQIDNEYDQLEAVLVHRPGLEIERLSHENMGRFLFEDIPYLRRMQDEHDAFTERIRERGVTVVYIEDLLRDVLRDEPTRANLIDRICRAEMVPAIAEDLVHLTSWDIDGLTELLFAGLTAEEYHAATGHRGSAKTDDETFLLAPIPNAYFTRDPAVIVRDAAISCKMHYSQRIRETYLMRAVLEHHPEFRDNAITYGGTDEPTEDRPYTIEGGDVIVLSPDAVLIGDSERTRSETIELLAAKCFRFGHVQRVYEIPIPAERAFMHLDTVLTIIDHGVVLWYQEVMEPIRYIHRYEPSDDPQHDGVRRMPDSRSLPELLRDEFDGELTLIPTAGGSEHFASREQRADGTNALALAPKVVMTYERNERTNAALEAHGVMCIGVDDSELVRGLGGPRCMTMPLRRRTLLPSKEATT